MFSHEPATYDCPVCATVRGTPTAEREPYAGKLRDFFSDVSAQPSRA